jgi:two-component system, LytTR family, sensor kinase
LKFYDFIFSDRLIPKVTRHFIFWSSFLIYFFYVNLLPASIQDLFHSKTYLKSFQLMIYAPVSIIAVYIAIYILLPRFIYPGKYLPLLGMMVGLTTLYFSIAWLITILFAALSQPVPYHELPVSFRWFQPVRYGIGFPLTSTILVIIIKLFKNFHLKQREHELLLRKKINNELQLLKTRFRPEFLYDALQHITYLILHQSVESPSILLKLSELLSYVLYEHEKEAVPLENELDILKTFLILKKTFHPAAFMIQFNQQVESKHLFISPLILLSIVGNCLDNLYQNGEQQIFLNLIIKTINNELHFQLECKGENENSLQSPEHYNRLLDSLNRIELLCEGGKSPDLFSENGTTYLILVLNLNEISSFREKVNETPILA